MSATNVIKVDTQAVQKRQTLAIESAPVEEVIGKITDSRGEIE